MKEQLIFVGALIVLMLLVPLFLIGFDFWAGIRKAKKRGEKIRSDKMQRTVQKISKYYNMILALTVLDILQMTCCVFFHLFNGWGLYTFPVLTLGAVAFVSRIEIKSIYEPADAKEAKEIKEAKALAETLAEAVLAHRQDPKEIAEALAKCLIKENENNQNAEA